MPPPRPLSQLAYQVLREGAGPRVITLHDRDRHRDGVRDHGLAAAPAGTVIGLEASKGVYVGKRITGYTWLVGPDHQPGPVSFGDALAGVERFLWDEVDRQAAAGVDPAALPFLLGVGQGAIVALAVAAVVPDLLSGVIAVGPSLPVVPGWAPPLAPLDGLPVLLVGGPASAPPVGAPVLTGEALVATLRGWGGVVTIAPAPEPGQVPGAAMAGWLADRRLRTRPSGAVRPGGSAGRPSGRDHPVRHAAETGAWPGRVGSRPV